MKYLNYKYAPLLIIVLLGAFLRFYQLGEVPSGVYVDEAALGYNAYAISETSRDEYGHFMPIFLRSFSAFSSPLYVYLSAISVSLLDLSAFSIRLLSALSGILTIVVIFVIIEKILKYKSKFTSLIATLIFALSPWSIFFSRAAFEANLGFIILAIAIYLTLSVDKFRNLLASAVLLGFSAYAYQSLRLIPLLLIPMHYLLFRNKKYNLKKALIISAVFFVTILPQIVISSSPAFGSRAAGLFYSDVVATQSGKIFFLPQQISFLLSLVREFSSQLFAYFSPANLFLLGDADPQRSIPEMGVYNVWVMVPYLVGLYTLTQKLPDKKALFVFAMMVIFATPAALSRDPFSTLRALNLLIPFSIVIALGVDNLIGKIGEKVSLVAIILLVASSLIGFWRGYFVLFASERAAIWNYGYKELAHEISTSNEHFVIDNSRIKPPHILLAFHMKIPAAVYQEFAKTKIIKGYYEDTEFDTYYALADFETRAIDWEHDIYKEQILVGDALAMSEEQVKEHLLEKVFEIRDPLNKLVFQGYRTNPEEKCRMIYNRNKYCI